MSIAGSSESFVDRMVTHLESNHLDTVMRLLPSSTFNLPLDEPEILEIFSQIPENFIDTTRKALVKILADYENTRTPEQLSDEYSRLRIRLNAQRADKLTQIKPESINSPICFHAVITGVNEKKSYIKKAHLECPNGHDVGSMNVDVTLERQLPIVGCPECDSKLIIDPKTSMHDYLQYGTVQEPPEEAKQGNPSEFDVIFTGDQTNDVTVGERKEIVGVLKAIYNPKANEHDLIIDTLSIQDMEGHQEIMPTVEDLKRYKSDAEGDSFLSDLAKSFAPEIIADDLLQNVKKTLLLALVGGTKTEKKRGDVNILLLGDPSVAKSSLLKFANKIVKKSIYTSGRGSSAAGLTIGIVKRPNGTSIAQAGVLPLCHKGFAFIDELDKMSLIDRSALHEAMEQQTVSISKAGITMSLPSETAVVAAANPKSGKWDPEMRVIDNINLMPTLLSRFDLKWLIRDVVRSDQDQKIARHILNEFATGVTGKYSENDITKILNHVRRIRPKLNEDAGTFLVEFYETLRKKSIDEQQAVIDTRQFESLVRIAFAYAKLHFRDEITLSDVKAVVDLYKHSLSSFGFNVDSGEIDQQTFEQSEKHSKEQSFWKAWKVCEDEEGYVQIAELIVKLEPIQQWWTESTVQAYCEKLHAVGKIYFNKNGWRKV